MRHVTSEVHDKGARKNLLTDEQKASNRLKSKPRAKVEHLFGIMTDSMDAMPVCTTTIFRATTKIALTLWQQMRCKAAGM